jgi:hypothetical protein
MLNFNFMCDQIVIFGHTLLCYLSPTYMFNKPALVSFSQQKLKLRYSFRCKQICMNYCYEFSHTVVPLKCDFRGCIVEHLSQSEVGHHRVTKSTTHARIKFDLLFKKIPPAFFLMSVFLFIYQIAPRHH